VDGDRKFRRVLLFRNQFKRRFHYQNTTPPMGVIPSKLGSARGGAFSQLAIMNAGSVRSNGRQERLIMSWKVEVVVDDSGEWVGDPLRFDTEQEALAYARDLEFRCSAVRDKRLMKSEDPVNPKFPAAGAQLSSRLEILRS
jgi:hypothetical protein